jgi:hypothetical protein
MTFAQVPLPYKLVVGAVAGVVGTSAIFPLGKANSTGDTGGPSRGGSSWQLGLSSCAADMVKTRLQSGNKAYTNPVSAAMSIYKTEGIRGFYRGPFQTHRPLGEKGDD